MEITENFDRLVLTLDYYLYKNSIHFPYKIKKSNYIGIIGNQTLKKSNLGYRQYIYLLLYVSSFSLRH